MVVVEGGGVVAAPLLFALEPVHASASLSAAYGAPGPASA
jgi:hypothetical protein